ncbi:MAG: hypothetical protein E7255_15525 [Lachnospiraceae bacterium]|nr:hypothetical protein [Lachnospiraceae bacterium]
MSNLHVIKNDGYGLKEIKEAIKDNINKTTQSFIAIGYYLKYVRDNKLFLEDGYESIWDFAYEEFNFSRSWASRCMAVNDKFSLNGNSPILQEQFKDYKKGILAEMLYLTDEQIAKTAPTTTRVEIRDLRTNHIDYCEADVDKELERRVAKFEALQDDNFIKDLRKRAQLKVDAVSLLKENITDEKQPRYCPHCHMLIEGDE